MNTFLHASLTFLRCLAPCICACTDMGVCVCPIVYTLDTSIHLWLVLLLRTQSMILVMIDLIKKTEFLPNQGSKLQNLNYA